MTVSLAIRGRRQPVYIDHEPTCDRCGHGASLHALDGAVPCIGCEERAAVGGGRAAACLGFASAWFDNSRQLARSERVGSGAHWRGTAP